MGMKIRLTAAILLGLLAGPALAQQPITVRDPGTGAVVPSIGDTTNNALRTVVISLPAITFGSPQPVTQSGAWAVSFTSAQPVTQSGTWNVGTITTLPAITFASPQAVTQSGTWSTRTLDGSGNTVSSTGGSLNVNCTGGCGGAATFADSGAFTFSTTPITNLGGVVDDVGTNTVAENSAGAARITAQRGVHANLRNVAGTEIGTASTPIRTDPTGGTIQPVSGTVTVTQGTAANLKVDLSGTAANATALKVDGSAVTQPVSGTVSITANSAVNVAQVGGTNTVTGGVAGLFAVGGPVASGATNADNPVKQGAVFNTAQPTVANGQVVDVQATARGAQIVATGADTFNVSVNTALPAGSAVIGHVIADSGSTTAVTGNVTVVQGTGTNLHAVLDTTSTTAVTQTTAANLNAQVQGAGASGAAKVGNPVQVAGVFNTAQPTVTTGQTVEAQATARGALIVASGADAIAVNNTQQGTANQNVTQFGSTNVSTGTGASGAGIPRVTVANDSNVLATQSGTWTLQPGNTANTTPWLFTISQGGNPATVSAGGALKVDGSAATQPISAVALPLPTGASTLTEQQTQTTALQVIDDLRLAQASTTSGQAGVLGQGAVTTAAPSYTTAQTSPLSLTTAGALRVDPSGVTQPVNCTTGCGTPAADAVGSPVTLTNVGDTASVVASSQQSIGAVFAAGSLVGVVVPECSMDGGTSWTPTYFDQANASKVGAIAFTAPATPTQTTIVAMGGCSHYRVRLLSVQTGTISATLRGTANVDPSVLFAAPRGSASLPPAVAVVGAVDPTSSVSALNVYQGALVVTNVTRPGLALPPCNPVRRYNCQAKGF